MLPLLIMSSVPFSLQPVHMGPSFHHLSSFQLPTPAVARREWRTRHFLGPWGQALHICSVTPHTHCIMAICHVSWIIKCHNQTWDKATGYSLSFLPALPDVAGRNVRCLRCPLHELLVIWNQGGMIKQVYHKINPLFYFIHDISSLDIYPQA